MKPRIRGFVKISQCIRPLQCQPGWTHWIKRVVYITQYANISSEAGLGTGCDGKVDIVPGIIVDKQRPVVSQS